LSYASVLFFLPPKSRPEGEGKIMVVKLILIGDAGTGKTHYLLKKAQNEFDDCTFISHTNSAVNELKKRDRNNKVFARTLHSLCFSLLKNKFKNAAIFSEQAKVEFCKRVNLKYDPNPYVSSPGAQFFSIRSLYINLKRPPVDRFCNVYRIDYDLFTYLLDEYERFKKERNLIDFEDMLEIALNHAQFRSEVVIIDEAQDLSPLQWEVVNSIFDADMIIAAGDELQSIFSFQGATPDRFLSFSNHVKVLRKNYRIPRNLWDFSYWMIRDQLQRPRSEPVDDSKTGTIHVLAPVTFKEAAKYISSYQSGLVAVRHNAYCLTLERLLRKEGIQPRLIKRDGFNMNTICIDTVHTIKGMEHERVFVIDAVKYPSYPAEEDRIWYTALTRAKAEIHVIPIAGEHNWVINKIPEAQIQACTQHQPQLQSQPQSQPQTCTQKVRNSLLRKILSLLRRK